MMIGNHTQSLWLTGMVDMYMDVDQTRRHVQPTDIHDLNRQGGVDVCCNLRDFPVLDGHVEDLITLILRVNHVAPLQQ
jgi:hypothetical protein